MTGIFQTTAQIDAGTDNSYTSSGNFDPNSVGDFIEIAEMIQNVYNEINLVEQTSLELIKQAKGRTLTAIAVAEAEMRARKVASSIGNIAFDIF